MAELYGKTWTRRELEARVGRIEQVAGARRLRLTEGAEAGVDVVRVRTGGGLSYDVVPSKGMDVSLVEFGGAPLSWQSPNGDVAPALFSADGADWLRTASGGLLMTCGLSSVGTPGTFEGRAYGLHGRSHHTPARDVCISSAWEDDEYVMRVTGVVEETEIFGSCLRLRREIVSTLGSARLTLRDTVENVGFASAPHMMLYHWNFGFPLLTEATRVRLPSRRAVPRDAGVPVDGYDSWTAPQAGFAEQVYYHDVVADADGFAEAEVRQPAFPLAGGAAAAPVVARLRWRTDTLPELVQWRMLGAGAHALGLEPANCRVEGLAAEAARGTLRRLEPGETVEYALEFSVAVEREAEER
ncbi:aldose 1-epimerase family protein [Paenibacillus sp.]|uniref:aldose 1-epimerase family protein n=1 Tax=Paenibacillus sp. TaxID=58172 RepID=UPI002D3A2618|nr:aldose 1-epimerase family protein [Paenibacillus sp.]HZG58516.1 aldose 1-epimerase family protein [Paenibacillus sp.]